MVFSCLLMFVDVYKSWKENNTHQQRGKKPGDLFPVQAKTVVLCHVFFF